MKYLAILFLFISANVSAQRKSGDCENGKGTYDFGWCIYTGDFKNGKPQGTGTMKYDDYSFTGEFLAGLENGRGIITYKDGRKETARFNKGIKEKDLAKVDAASFKPLEGQHDECVRGNCITGYGTMEFPSGNKYVGNFVNRKRQGIGAFFYANGDKFEGTFNEDLKEIGTYSFNTGYVFKGSYLNDDFYDGIFTAANGQSVQMVKGKVIAPPPVSISKKGNSAPGCTNPITCPHCYGKGVESKPITQTLSWSQRDTYSIDRYGKKDLVYAGQSGNNTYSIPNFAACGRCGGKGTICK